jgi:hypothetical protein
MMTFNDKYAYLFSCLFMHYSNKSLFYFLSTLQARNKPADGSSHKQVRVPLEEKN